MSRLIWGSKEFDRLLQKEIRRQSKESKTIQNENRSYLVNNEYREMIKVSEVDPSLIDYMLSSGGYRYAKEEEVTKEKLYKKIKKYLQ